MRPEAPLAGGIAGAAELVNSLNLDGSGGSQVSFLEAATCGSALPLCLCNLGVGRAGRGCGLRALAIILGHVGQGYSSSSLCHNHGSYSRRSLGCRYLLQPQG